MSRADPVVDSEVRAVVRTCRARVLVMLHVNETSDLQRRAEAIGRAQDAAPAPKAQRKFTGPESRIMKTADGFQPCDDAQGAVTVGSQLIVTVDLVQAPNDTRQL